MNALVMVLFVNVIRIWGITFAVESSDNFKYENNLCPLVHELSNETHIVKRCHNVTRIGLNFGLRSPVDFRSCVNTCLYHSWCYSGAYAELEYSCYLYNNTPLYVKNYTAISLFVVEQKALTLATTTEESFEERSTTAFKENTPTGGPTTTFNVENITTASMVNSSNEPNEDMAVTKGNTYDSQLTREYVPPIPTTSVSRAEDKSTHPKPTTVLVTSAAFLGKDIVGPAVGGCVAGTFVVGFLLLTILCFMHRRRINQQQKTSQSSTSFSESNTLDTSDMDSVAIPTKQTSITHIYIVGGDKLCDIARSAKTTVPVYECELHENQTKAKPDVTNVSATLTTEVLVKESSIDETVGDMVESDYQPNVPDEHLNADDQKELNSDPILIPCESSVSRLVDSAPVKTSNIDMVNNNDFDANEACRMIAELFDNIGGSVRSSQLQV